MGHPNVDQHMAREAGEAVVGTALAWLPTTLLDGHFYQHQMALVFCWKNLYNLYIEQSCSDIFIARFIKQSQREVIVIWNFLLTHRKVNLLLFLLFEPPGAKY